MSKKKGFTLIEVLIVILIIAILAAIAFPKYEAAVMKARYSELMTIVHNLKNAEEIYLIANGDYTERLELLDITYPITDYGENTGYKIAEDIHCSVHIGVLPNYFASCWRTPYMGYTVSMDKGLPSKVKYCFAGKDTMQVCRSMGGINPTEYREGFWRFVLP